MLFVIILLVNVYFLFSWCRKVLPIVYNTIMNTFRRPRENYQVRPFVRVGPGGPDISDMSNSKSESVIRPGDSRVSATQFSADRTPASADLPPPNTTHVEVVYTLSLLERPEDFRKAGELEEEEKSPEVLEIPEEEKALDDTILSEKHSP